jgi:hypothetical protein
MRRNIISILVFAATLFAVAESYVEPLYLTTIPLDCERVGQHLKDLETPNGFKVSLYEAHILAMKASNIIKPCASKLEQAIYFDNQYYYFTNSVLFYGKHSFPDKFVKVNGFTGEAISNF